MDNFKDFLDNIDMREVIESLEKGNLQASLNQAKEKIAQLKVKGESGGGLVKVEINGNHKLSYLDIDESLLSPENKTMLQDLVIAAIQIATRNLEEEVSSLRP